MVKKHNGINMQIKSKKFLRWLLFFTLCLIAFLVAIKFSLLKLPSKRPHTNFHKLSLSTADSSAQSNSKTKRWQNMEKEVASWRDALGLKIDPEIKKMVVVLNLLNFKTTQSCEGHIDWGRPYPWVRITTKSPELSDLFNKRKKILDFIREQETKTQKKHPRLSLGEALRKENSLKILEAHKKIHPLNDKIEKTSRLMIIQLKKLVTDFYKKHPIDPDKMLVLSKFGFENFELFSLGGDWQVIRDNNEKLKKLQEYQKEMNLFADFLTDYYFNTNPI